MKRELRLKGEYITLGQLLKAAGLAGSGSEAKEYIVSGMVKVNGEVDTRRGRKLYPGDKVVFEGPETEVVR